MLPLRVGASRATRAIVTGQTQEARYWHDAGLVSVVAPQTSLLDAAAAWFDTHLSPHSAVALAHAVAAARLTLRAQAEPALDRAERDYLGGLIKTDDAAEGVQAFLEKRAPNGRIRKRTDMIDVDVWVRGQQDATTRRIEGVPEDAASWTDDDVKSLLEQMLMALERAKNPERRRAGDLAARLQLDRQPGRAWRAGPPRNAAGHRQRRAVRHRRGALNGNDLASDGRAEAVEACSLVVGS